MSLGTGWVWLAVPATVTALAGCASAVDVAPEGADLTPIVVTLPSGSPSSGPSAGSVTGDDSSPVTDPAADLDIDDQVGDGRSVVIEAVDTDLRAVHIVIETRDGQILGSDLRTAGLQPVTLRLDQVVSEPTELVGRMLADDGDGILEVGVDRPVIDDEGEQVAEDFDYVFTPDDLADD
jgi:hypothetical protein